MPTDKEGHTPGDIFEATIVVLAEAHNPSLLHPAFLVSREVVPADWTVRDDQTICSAPFSSVQFDNGLSLQVEQHRLAIRHQQFASDVEASVIPEIAKRYLQTLPQVPYKSIGINFAAFVAKPNATSWLLERYLKDEPVSGRGSMPASIGLRARYVLDTYRFTIQIDTGQRGGASLSPEEGLILRGNYHHDVEPDLGRRSVDRAVAAVAQFSAHLDDFRSQVKSVALADKVVA